MQSVFDPRQARWERVEVPACRGGRPAVVRTRAPLGYGGEPRALLDDISLGLSGWFTDVLPVGVTVDPPDARRGCARFVHAGIDRDGLGIVVETLLRRDGEMSCWVAPTTRYPVELGVARRAMARRPVPPVSAGPAPDSGVPVAEGRLTVRRTAEPSVWTMRRRGPVAEVDGPSGDRVRLPASAWPLWTWRTTGAGPQPTPAGRRMLITSRSALDRLLRLGSPDEAAVREALDAPDLPAVEAADLCALVRELGVHWSLDWLSGLDGTLKAADEDWSTARVLRRGRMEVIDAGVRGGLWRILSDLPVDLTDEPYQIWTDDPAAGGNVPLGASGPRSEARRGERGPDVAVALVRATPADIWHELTVTVAS